jgi:putative acetyltransferase
MANISIHRAANEDAADISALALRAIRITNAHDYTPAEIEATCNHFTIAKVLEKMLVRDVFVAIRDGRILGTISLGGGKLHSLFVDPVVQGQGIGRTLVAHLEAHARQQGLTRLWLSSSITAGPFYAKLGYHAFALHELKDFPAVPMEKTMEKALHR